ncbi:AlbA family DNA-binding domain-containing protein [Cecembia lonarensis]|uniref:Divergent AAA domain protein n=1 Tax=Cecembia lonarensis (strain CCUG 58316 / KCTC 22772 / LW9) TaxID=1225176 RepID=K1LC79_CECL9|nr:ATP-binding protein [Cecembia lonarensis]EKB47993.1 Divergent AAA domain protein [Cecembia lonarensis LW9]
MEIKKDMDVIHQLLKDGEGEKLDFKQSINKSSRIAKTLVAFANTEGGKIAVGISDRGKIKGVDPEEEKFMINQANNQFCVPPVFLNFETYEVDYLDGEELEEEIYVLIVNVTKSSRQHSYKNPDGSLSAYIRNKDKTLPV